MEISLARRVVRRACEIAGVDQPSDERLDEMVEVLHGPTMAAASISTGMSTDDMIDRLASLLAPQLGD